MSEPKSENSAKPVTVMETLERAVAHHRVGQLPEAERLYRAVLRAEPRQPDANHNLGALAMSVGQFDAALPFLTSALEVDPKHPQYWLTYINAFLSVGDFVRARQAIERAEHGGISPDVFQAARQILASQTRGEIPTAPSVQETKDLVRLFGQGHYAEAEETARSMTQKFPAHGFGWNVLGAALKMRGRPKDALPAAEEAARLLPNMAEVHNNLGIILHTLGRFPDAERSFRRVIEIEPRSSDAYNSLGGTLVALKRLAEAEASFRRGVEFSPNDAKLYQNLAAVQKELGELDEAKANCERAITLKPDYAEAHINLGSILRGLGRPREAEAEYRRAIELKPDYAEATNNLGVLLRDQGRMQESEACYRRALELQPSFTEAQNNLAEVLNAQGRMDEAIVSYRRALEIKPDNAVAHSNLLLSLNYPSHVSPEDLYREHCRWEEQQANSQIRLAPAIENKDPCRRLRIGYVSPDLRQHSVPYFLEPVLREHDRAAVEIFCYADVLRPDAVTTRLQELADHWTRTIGLTAEELAERIRTDKIDILVDLAGHTAGNRLLVFALKPAPVQAIWLGYPNTTGLRAIDYRLVDAVTDPLGVADAYATERLLRLEGGFLCYAPPRTAPAPKAAPCTENGYITFGSFNNAPKLSSSTLEAWGALLRRVTGSRLLLKAKLFNEASSRTAFLAKLETHGIEPKQVSLLGETARVEAHLETYGQMDIALDPFPYNGTTTTCEAIWMGVPVVTLRGDRHAARVGASLFTQVGLTELVSDSVDAYVEIAAGLASDFPRLVNYRRTLREQMAASSLCAAAAFTRKLEFAYREMWQTYCSDSNLAEPRGKSPK